MNIRFSILYARFLSRDPASRKRMYCTLYTLWKSQQGIGLSNNLFKDKALR